MSQPHDPLEITPTLLLRAYAAGVFPMSDGAGSSEIFWVDPKMRGVIPLHGLHISKSLRKTIRKGGFAVEINRDFNGTVIDCADRSETWINTEIQQLYDTLHRMGYAHSVEVWRDGARIGGLYGVSLGGAFFGESMYSAQPNASKIALVWLVARMRFGGYKLLDTQFITDHLASLGAVEVTRDVYHRQLEYALGQDADFAALPASFSADQVLQLSTQTS